MAAIIAAQAAAKARQAMSKPLQAGGSMKSIKVNMMFWVAGWVAGVVLMERWRRHGGRYVPVESVVAVAAPAASTGPSPSDDKPRTSALIVRGAKADAERVRRMLKKAMPSRSDSVGATAP